MDYFHASESWEAHTSLWHMIQNLVPVSEQNDIKSMLGESLVEQSLELHDEIESLLSIWKSLSDETKQKNQSVLPEPPDVRERLKIEIQFLVENIRSKAEEGGRDPDLVLSRNNTEIINYASSQSRPSTASSGELSFRPTTAKSSVSSGRGSMSDSPLRLSTPSSGRRSSSSMISSKLDGMNDKLNILKFEEVVQHLQETLEEEITILLEDIKTIQDCIENEVDNKDITEPEPSLIELKQERSKLEKQLLTSDKVNTAIPVISSQSRRLPLPLARLPSLGSPPTSANATRHHSTATSHRKNSIEHTGLNPGQYSPVEGLNPGQYSPVDNSSPVNSSPTLVGLYRVDSNVSQGPKFTPSPPTSGKGPRPRSTARFRKTINPQL